MRIGTRITLAAITAASCGACTAAPQDVPSATASATTTATATSGSAGQAAADAYVAMWRDVADASTTSDWRSPRLGHHATGDALATVTAQLRRDQELGLVAKGSPTHQPRVSSQDSDSDPRKVLLEDCGDSTTWLRYKASTGELADSSPGGRRSISAEVVLVDGLWKVARFVVRGVGTC